MKAATTPETAHCPLCTATPENGDRESLAWSDFCNASICGRCGLALSLEVFERESELFTKAARMLGVDLWECRKRFLLDSIARTREQLHHETEKVISAFLESGMIRCTNQVAAIDRFLKLREGTSDPDLLAAEEEQLHRTLARRDL